MTFVTLEQFSKSAVCASFAKHPLLENVFNSNKFERTSKGGAN